MCFCLCEVTSELDSSLIGYVMKCNYEITDRMLEQAHSPGSVAVGCAERSGTRGVRGGFGCACSEWGSMM